MERVVKATLTECSSFSFRRSVSGITEKGIWMFTPSERSWKLACKVVLFATVTLQRK